MRVSALPIAVTACALLIAEQSFAQANVFEVPAECGSELEFAAELERLAGADASRARHSLVHIERDAVTGAYRLTLEVGGRRRELQHADCRVLMRSAAVIAAASVKVDANTTPAVAVPAQPALATPSVAERAVPPPPADSGARSSEPAPRWRGHLAVGVGIAVGVVPSATPAAELRGGVSRGHWGATLAGRYFAPQSVTVDGRSADIRAFGVRAAGVVAPTRWLSVSVGLDVELLVGRGGGGVALPATDSAWTLAPSAELTVIPIQNEHLALELAAAGRVALVRPVFEVGGFGELYRVPSLGMAAFARGVWRFP